MTDVQKTKSLVRQGFGMCIALSLEFILGITTTFFVKFPDNAPKEELWKFSWTQIPLALHIIFGLIIFVGSFVLVIRSIQLKNKHWTIASLVGIIAIIGSLFGGSTFIPTQKDIYSFIMAIGFIVALVAYFWGIFASHPQESKNVA